MEVAAGGAGAMIVMVLVVVAGTLAPQAEVARVEDTKEVMATPRIHPEADLIEQIDPKLGGVGRPDLPMFPMTAPNRREEQLISIIFCPNIAFVP